MLKALLLRSLGFWSVPILAFSYSVRKVQPVKVSGNLLKRGAVSSVFRGDCPFMGGGGRSPPLPSLLLHYNTAAAHSFPFIWPLCCKALWVDSPSGGLSITTSRDHKTELRENSSPLVMQRDITEQYCYLREFKTKPVNETVEREFSCNNNRYWLLSRKAQVFDLSANLFENAKLWLRLAFTPK